MESINPDDIEDIDYNQISLITLKNGNLITIDKTIPAKKSRKNKEKRNSFLNYQISQKLINLTIIGKKDKEKITNDYPTNFNHKNKICPNTNFFYSKNKNDIPSSNNNDIKEKKKNFLFDNFKYTDIGNKKYTSLKLNLIGNNPDVNENNKNEILKTDSNKEEKEIEKIKMVEMDLDSKSKNEYKTLINEFDNKRKSKIKLEHRINNINYLLNSNKIIKEQKKFDFTNHFNLLVNKFRNKINDIKRENINKRYYEIYKDINNKNRKNNLLYKNKFNAETFYDKDNYASKSNKYLKSSSAIRNNNIYLRNNNIISLRDNIIRKHSSYDPKIFRTLYLGQQIILPSNKLI